MSIQLSLITPMYNESNEINQNIDAILETMDALSFQWEYILVDDGSTDDSLSKARKKLKDRNNCHIIHYPQNRGRGYALRQGFAQSCGKYVITTESDLSWGPSIIPELYSALLDRGDDVVIASTYLETGGHDNVPLLRKWISRIGNVVLRNSYGANVTMLSGMTRGYKGDKIRSLYLEENEKHIHLEIVTKSLLLGLRISEIPARIKWSMDRGKKSVRSQLMILKHANAHLASALSVGGLKILSHISIGFFVIGILLSTYGIANKLFLLTANPMPNLINYGLFCILISVASFLNAVLGAQLASVQKSIAHLQSTQQDLRNQFGELKKNIHK